MVINELFGLPAHPLVVHAAVVLLPIAALVTLFVALTATTAVGLAQQSGEAFEERVDETELVEAHTEQGETVLPWAIGLTVTAAAVTAAGLLRRRYPQLTAARVTAVLILAAVVTGGGATWTVVDVGHSVAKATWDDLPSESG